MGEPILPRWLVPPTTSPYEGFVMFMGEPIPEGPEGKPEVKMEVTVYTPKEDELELCEARCGSRFVKRKVVHECILHRDHQAVVAQHMCNCGLVWSEAELQ